MALTWYNGFSPKARLDSLKWQKAEIAAGRLAPPARCEACGQTAGPMDYHAEDYSRPFGPHVVAHELCFRCHMVLHARHRDPRLWARYLDQLEAGAVFAPIPTRGDIGLIWIPGWVHRPAAWGPTRPRLEFFRGLPIGRHITAPPDDQPTLF